MTSQDSTQVERGVASFVEDLNGAVRENPVAASLVGLGILWMFAKSERGSGFGGLMQSATHSVANITAGARAEIGEATRETAHRVGEVSRQVGGTVSSGLSDAAGVAFEKASVEYDGLKVRGRDAGDAVTHLAEEAARSSTQFGPQIGMSLQQNLTKTLEAQPLLLGVIGIAIGVGVASVFPTTAIEQNFMGEAGAAVKDAIQEVAGDAAGRVRDVVTEVKKEAAAQGFTVASATDGLKDVGDKVRGAAASSAASVKERLS